MSRIEKFYETRFRRLAKFSGESPDAFSLICFQRAAEWNNRGQLGFHFALALIQADLRKGSGETQNFPKKYLCDAGLGGLARWIRAAGYESHWEPGLDDAALIRRADQTGATLITTDTMMMERGVLRDNLVPAICVPPSLACAEQLVIIFRELGLALRDPRCMACGGELSLTPKSAVIDRIPARTALWLDEYFTCTECHRLFWRGTHWRRIVHQLEKAAAKNELNSCESGPAKFADRNFRFG